MAATILIGGEHHIENLPDLRDVRTMGRLIANLGGFILKKQGGPETTKINNYEAPYDLVSTMRASRPCARAAQARLGKAKVSCRAVAIRTAYKSPSDGA
jgi:UDP-N-acetylglucosamine 1-carboxyvinyltransferase